MLWEDDQQVDRLDSDLKLGESTKLANLEELQQLRRYLNQISEKTSLEYIEPWDKSDSAPPCA